jgi:hypothetical protein
MKKKSISELPKTTVSIYGDGQNMNERLTPEECFNLKVDSRIKKYLSCFEKRIIKLEEIFKEKV